MPDEYICHFVRGYFDGDGCIHFSSYHGYFQVHFIGTASFIRYLQCYIKQNVLFDSRANGSITDSSSCKRLDYHGVSSPLSVLNWMYKDSDESIHLDRKYALYCKFREISDLTPQHRKEEMIEFLASNAYKSLFQCKNHHCCPHVVPKRLRNYTKIQQIDKDSLGVIKIWDNPAAIRKQQGYDCGYISKACRGKCKQA
eukprot:37485_1